MIKHFDRHFQNLNDQVSSIRSSGNDYVSAEKVADMFGTVLDAMTELRNSLVESHPMLIDRENQRADFANRTNR